MFIFRIILFTRLVFPASIFFNAVHRVLHAEHRCVALILRCYMLRKKYKTHSKVRNVFRMTSTATRFFSVYIGRSKYMWNKLYAGNGIMCVKWNIINTYSTRRIHAVYTRDHEFVFLESQIGNADSCRGPSNSISPTSAVSYSMRTIHSTMCAEFFTVSPVHRHIRLIDNKCTQYYNLMQ